MGAARPGGWAAVVAVAIGAGLWGCAKGRLSGTEVENAVPEAVDDAVTTDEDVPVAIDLLANDTDANDDPLEIDSVEAPGAGTVTPTATGVLYAPAPDYFGADRFDYVIRDPLGATATASVVVTIRPVNDVPEVVAPWVVTTTEDSASSLVTLTGDDPEDGETLLSVTVVERPWHGRLSATAGAAPLVVTFTPDPNFAGADLFTVRVRDSAGGLSEVTEVALVVEPVNDPPTVVVNAGLTLPEGGIAVLGPNRLAAADVDDGPEALSFTVDVAPSHGQLRRFGADLVAGDSFTQAEIDAGWISYDHDGAGEGTDGFDFTLRDGEASVGGSVGITILPVGDAPVLVTNATLTVAEGASGGVDSAHLSTADVDTAADQLTYSLEAAPEHGELRRGATPLAASDTFTQADVDAGQLSYGHDGSETLADTFGFTVTDGTDVVSGTFLIAVTSVNDPPVVEANVGLTLSEGDTQTINALMLRATDVDDEPGDLLFTLTTAPQSGELRVGATPLGTSGTFTQAEIDAGELAYAHDGSETTADNLELILGDGEATLPAFTFAITVTAGSDPPELLVNAGLRLDEGASTTIGSDRLAAADSDNGPGELVYTLDLAPEHGEVRRSAAPIAAGGTFTQADVDLGRMSYAHDGSETVADRFAFTVSDGTTPLFGNLFAIEIQPVSDPPVLDVNEPLSVEEGGSGAITHAHLSASDVDDGATEIRFTITATPTRGTLYEGAFALTSGDAFSQADLQAGVISYVHDGSNNPLSDAFGFQVGDGENLLAGSSFAILITPVNALPVAAAPVTVITVDQDAATPALILTGSDEEDAVSALTVSVTAGPDHGSLDQTSGAAPLSVVYTPAAGFTGEDSFAFTVADSDGGVSTALSIEITVVGALRTTVDASGGAGAFVDLTLVGTRLYLAYRDDTAGEVKVARSDDRGISWPVVRSVGSGTRPRIGGVGSAVHVAYFDDGALNLDYARSDDFGDTWGASGAIDDTTGTGAALDLVVEAPTGDVYVSYHETNLDDLIVTSSTTGGDTWPAASRETVDGAEVAGAYHALALRSLSVFVVYHDATNQKLVLARSSDEGDTFPDHLDVDVGPLAGGALDLVADCSGCVNQLFVVYYDPGADDLRFARSDNNGAAWPTALAVDTAGDVGDNPALAVADGSVFVSYYDRDAGALRFARSDDAGATWPVVTTVDDTVDAGEWSAIGLTGDVVFIAYSDGTHGELELARSADRGDTW